jgi:hypothetical protein
MTPAAGSAAAPDLRAAAGGDAGAPTSDTTKAPSPGAANASQVRLGWLGFGLAMALGLVIGTARFWEVDTWWHLSVGQHILDTGTLRGPDAWARFADRPYTATQWLPEAVAAWLVGLVGPGGVVFLRALSVLTLVALLYGLGRLSAGRLTAGLVAVVALLGAGAGLNPRPQLVSFVLFAVTVFAWWRTAHDHRPRWWLVPVYWLWACSHGLWSIGLAVNGILLAALVLDPRTRPDLRATARLGAVLAACTLAVAVTPLGPSLLGTPFEVAGNAAGIAEEWRATPLNNIFSIAAMAMVVGTALLWLWTRRRPPVWKAVLLLTSMGLVLAMWRLVPMGSIVAAPLLADALGAVGHRPEPRTRTERKVVAVTWAVFVLLAAALSLSPAGERAQQFPGNLAGVDRALDALPAGTVVLDDFALSGWLIHEHPDLVPVADLRVEIYSADHLHSYVRTERVEPGWEQLLATTGARHAVLQSDSALATALQQRLAWTVVATTDNTATHDNYVLLRAGR